MRRIPLQRLKTGMKLAADVRTERGTILMRGGTAVRPTHIVMLRRYGIVDVLVADPRLGGVEVQEIISAQVQAQVSHLFDQIRIRMRMHPSTRHGQWFYDNATPVAEAICEGMIPHGTLIPTWQPERWHEIHAINVAVISAALTQGAGAGRWVPDVVFGALLHDVGHLRNATGGPAPIEDVRQELPASMHSHPHDGVDLIDTPLISAVAKVIVRQHHERWDGQGFPKGLRGEEIHRLAQLTAMADIYVTLISHPENAVAPHNAIEFLLGSAGFELGHEVVELLPKTLTPYPVGTLVCLNDQRHALVVKTNKGLPNRPRLKILENKLRPKEDFDLGDPANNTTVIESLIP